VVDLENAMWLPRAKNLTTHFRTKTRSFFGIPNAGFGEGERDAVASFSFLFLGTTLLLLRYLCLSW
jgi:hypothetical protein